MAYAAWVRLQGVWHRFIVSPFHKQDAAHGSVMRPILKHPICSGAIGDERAADRNAQPSTGCSGVASVSW
jgi:hypothetical protein